MKKFIPLFLGLMLPLAGAFAADDPTMDAANQSIINACRTAGGTYISYKDDKCDYSGCAYIGTNGDVKYDGDNERVQGGCSINDYRNKAKTAYKAELDKKIKDLEDAKRQADKIGSRGNGDRDKYDINGDGVVDSKDDLNGDGKVDDKDLEEANRRLGSAGGTTGTNGTNGSAQSGGSQSSGNENPDGSITCVALEGAGVIEKGGLCYNECREKRTWYKPWEKKEGVDRASCVECLLKYPHLYSVKKEYLPRGKDGKVIGDTSVSLGKAVSVKTGVVICKDSKGNVVHVPGTSCGPGYVLVGSGSTAGAGGGAGTGISIGVGGGVGVGAGGSGSAANRPAYCNSSKPSDIQACDAWMAKYERGGCAAGSDPAHCMGEDYYKIMARYGTDCVNCAAGGRQQSTLSGVAEIVGAIAPPLAQIGVAYLGYKGVKAQANAWSNAAAAGFQQCQLSQNNYLNYLSANELPAMTPEQQARQNCNGYQLSAYGGLGGGMNPWLGAGYSPGFMAGMMGPYGMYNPYGSGIGINIGGGGMYPGYMGGAMGGTIGGINIGGGMYPGGGYMGGAVGGMYPGGGYMGGTIGGINIGGGMPGGYMGGAVGGMYPGGGYMGGTIGGINIGGGMPGGYMGGAVGGMYPGGGFNGGITGGMYPGGWGSGTAYPGGYGPTGMPGAGGYWGNTGGWGGGANPQMDYYNSMQASQYDRMQQMQGTMAQSQMGGNYGQFGSAAFSPMNMGFNGGFQAGVYLGM